MNIAQMAVGRSPDGDAESHAVMVLTTDAPAPAELVERVKALDGFVSARAVSL